MTIHIVMCNDGKETLAHSAFYYYRDAVKQKERLDSIFSYVYIESVELG